MGATYQPPQWLIPDNANTDKVGNYSFDFDGTADYIDLGSGTDLELTGDFSVSAWVKDTSDLNRGIVCCGDRSNGSGWMMWRTSAHKAAFAVWTVSNRIVYSTTLINTGDWFHIVGTFEKNGTANQQVKIYINGNTTAEDENGWSGAQTPSYSGTIYKQIGFPYVGSNYFEGNISEVSVFNYLLSADNITTLYGDATDGVGNPMGLDVVPVAYWKGDRSAFGGAEWAVPNQVSQGGTSLYSNYSFDFDGVDDYITTGTLSSLLDNKSKLSISFWINLPDAGETNRICGKYIGLNKWLAVSCSTDQVYFIVSGTGTVPSESLAYGVTGAILTDNTWHNIVCVFDGTQVVNNDRGKIYVDGVDEALTYNNNFPSATYDFSTEGSPPNWDLARSGLNPTSDELRGNASEYAIYSGVALESTMVEEIYNSGRPGNLTSLDTAPDLWWRMGEDAFASVASPTAWTIPDQIGSNDGTSAGNPELVGEAPQSYANGLSDSMDIYDRIGESGFSDLNALSYNMPKDTRKAY